MTETTAVPRDKAQDTYAIASATMCHDFVAALLEELRNMPGHWATLPSDRQQKILDTLKTKVRATVETAAAIMMRSEFQAVEATLEYVSRKKGFSAGLTIKTDALHRHGLVDAVGARVLVVIADPKRWVERMDELKVATDQADLFDTSARANYDEARDQPAYRRDQDPTAVAGTTWAELKANLMGGNPTPPPDEEPKPDAGKVPEADTNLTPAQENEVALRLLQEGLAGPPRVEVSLGFLQSRTPEQIAACEKWLAFYTGKTTPATPDDIPDRPEWLPLPKADK